MLTGNRLPVDHLALVLQRCIKAKTLPPGKQLHAFLLTTGTDLNRMSLGAKLVGLYASCGNLSSARKVFDEIPKPNVFALNWMVLASAFDGNYADAIKYFSMMQKQRAWNKFSFLAVLKACTGLMDLNKGKEVHGMVYRLFLGDDLSVANALIDMYCKCGGLQYAQRVFCNMPVRDVVSWTSMICGYCNEGKVEEGLVLFEKMKLEGLEPNEFTWNAMIVGQARIGDRDGVISMFTRMKNEGLLPDLVTWNALISGFVESHHPEEALRLFGAMLASGVKPDHVTVTGLLPACGLTGTLQRGREIHGLIYRIGLDRNVYVASALIDMYSKCGNVKDSSNVFGFGSQIKNIASWNAMIGCYGKHGMVNESLRLFEMMKEEGLQPNEVTFVSVLSACSHGGLVEKGLQIFQSMEQKHSYIKLQREHYACIVDLLCRSGRMIEAYKMVRKMSVDVTQSILGAFFNGCIIHGRKDLAKSMTKDLKKLQMNNPGDFVTLSNIYAAGEEWEGVENVRKLMRVKQIRKVPAYSWVEERDGSW
ncbi:hypothetical protein CRG98_020756 [Punica granatum]|uniref:Pentatricopeptide repeat-containing protein At5g59600-like n=2 Tax=Punica granatum TaxID=22663 RepID=A0A2I0JRB8_PUNGR|nr:hypothetical protein CRG98_020756 [Punica granatum]